MTASIFKSIEQTNRTKLINAIKRMYDKETREDILNHGMSAGFSGLIYYTETGRFYNRHKEAIWDIFCEAAEEMGLVNPFELLAKGNGSSVGDMAQAENYMCWYAVEYAIANYID